MLLRNTLKSRLVLAYNLIVYSDEEDLDDK